MDEGDVVGELVCECVSVCVCVYIAWVEGEKRMERFTSSRKGGRFVHVFWSSLLLGGFL